MTSPRHRILIRYGYLPERISDCTYPRCRVSSEGETGCGEWACPSCGVGPMDYVNPINIFYCTQCDTTVGVVNSLELTQEVSDGE